MSYEKLTGTVVPDSRNPVRLYEVSEVDLIVVGNTLTDAGVYRRLDPGVRRYESAIVVSGQSLRWALG